MKKHERGHGIRKIWRPSNNLRDRPRDWCANRYVEIYFCFLIRCCVRGVVGSFHSWRGRVIFRAIKVKAIVSRSDRSISFCSTLFILSFSLSFSLLFFPIRTILLLIRFFIATRECLFRSIETSESSWFVQNRSTCRALTLFFFFSFIQCMQFSIISRDVQTLDWIYVEGKLQARSTCDPAKTFWKNENGQFFASIR